MMEKAVETRRFLSLALFTLGVLFFMALALVAGQWVPGFLVAVVFVAAGVVFRRRGK